MFMHGDGLSLTFVNIVYKPLLEAVCQSLGGFVQAKLNWNLSSSPRCSSHQTSLYDDMACPFYKPPIYVGNRASILVLTLKLCFYGCPGNSPQFCLEKSIVSPKNCTQEGGNRFT